MLRRLTCTVPAGSEGAALADVVRNWLANELALPLSRSAARQIIMAGAIRVDGRINRRAGVPVAAGARLEAAVDLARLRASPASRHEPPKPVIVLYQDEDLIAVAKPAGLPTHATADPGRDDLFTLVRRYLADLAGHGPRAGSAAPLPYLGLHHRLDVDTSGVVLFARSERANHGLARQFADRLVEKTYHALAVKGQGRAGHTWRVANSLALVGSGRRARVQSVDDGGADALTSFALVEALRDAWLVEARPKTGRKHQIRAHLAGQGTPILGDARYGGPPRAGRCEAPRVMLHASRLALEHPVTGAPISIDAPYPDDFRTTLECLRRAHPATISAR